MGTTLPDGMRRALRELRETGEPLPAGVLVQRLFALTGPPLPEVAGRLLRELLETPPAALPTEIGPAAMRPAEERRVAGLGLDEAAFVVVDVETTGLSPRSDVVIEIGAARVARGRVGSLFETLLRPPGPGPLSARIQSLTGIDDAMLAEAPPAARALARFRSWLDAPAAEPWVAHNARFDHGFLCRAFRAQWGEEPRVALLCTQKLSRRLLPRLGRYDLDHVCAHFGIRNRARHRALGDAQATARLWLELLELARQRGLHRVGDLLDLQARPTRRRRRGTALRKRGVAVASRG